MRHITVGVLNHSVVINFARQIFYCALENNSVAILHFYNVLLFLAQRV